MSALATVSRVVGINCGLHARVVSGFSGGSRSGQRLRIT